MKTPRILIITGYGVNCEAESATAWKRAGADVNLVHINDLLKSPNQLDVVDGMMLIGGFSYGDHMSSGHVFAQRIKHHLKPKIQNFINEGKLILGICNGFQVMTKMGLLPGLNNNYFNPLISLIQNDCGFFQNYWTSIRFEDNCNCVFTKGLEIMPLPIRHGEGKIFTLDDKVIEQIENQGCVAARYVDKFGNPTQSFPDNPNGSINAIAGLSDPSGRIFGMMPHPEAYLFPENHPQWDIQKVNNTLPKEGLGVLLFRNAVNAIQNN